MRKALWFVAGAVSVPVVAFVAGLIFLKTGTSGFSARARPTWLETLVATQRGEELEEAAACLIAGAGESLRRRKNGWEFDVSITRLTHHQLRR